MQWVGKVIGGYLGLTFYGPFGLFLGAAFGHAFDEEINGRRREQEAKRIKRQFAEFDLPNDFHDLRFIVPVFAMLAKLARVDAPVNAREIAEVENFMTAIELRPDTRQLAIGVFRDSKNSTEGFNAYLGAFSAKYASESELLTDVLEIMIRVAAVDGPPGASEMRLLERTASAFRIKQSAFDMLCKRYFAQTKEASHYGILGCSAKSSVEEIKRNYRKLVNRYHPDKLTAKELSKSDIKQAQEKFRKVQAAYEAIRLERGFC